MSALTLTETREREEAESHHESIHRWLAVSQPLAVDDDPDWDDPGSQSWSYDHTASDRRSGSSSHARTLRSATAVQAGRL
jgi:hypothetical protein